MQWTGTLAANADAALVHLQLAGDLARPLDGDADDARARGAAGHAGPSRSSGPSAEYVTYWITVTNLTADPVAFEGRYCILSRY